LSAAIRPEHVTLADGGVAAEIRDVQPVGPSTLVKLGWTGGAVVARLGGIVRLAVGQRARFSIDTANLMFFDRDSGTRIDI